jgi:hypothetical protein
VSRGRDDAEVGVVTLDDVVGDATGEVLGEDGRGGSIAQRFIRSEAVLG